MYFKWQLGHENVLAFLLCLDKHSDHVNIYDTLTLSKQKVKKEI